ncbi:sugar phosphate isomerase/epimerase [Alcaligenaceae bacterium]|nr:sugar phosphate isomerase/epimerase [Alcaligenaceae bacterium]
MNTFNQVIISLSSFGTSEVRRHGQRWFVELCHAAGADGVEIRGELLQGRSGELAELAACISAAGLVCVYSSPEVLWSATGELNLPALERGLAGAAALDAATLKMSMGDFGQADPGSLSTLRAGLAEHKAALLIENDQTASAGTLDNLQGFFHATDAYGLDVGMTFDMGNWHWQGECPLLAAQALSARVRYVHCKGVQRQPMRWLAVPLIESAAPWRAILRALPRGLMCAIEYPLAGDDLLGTTRAAIAELRNLKEKP